MPSRRNNPRSRKSGTRSARAPRHAAVSLADEQIAGRYRTEHEEIKRWECTLNLFWMNCPNKACRRVRRCAGDPFACFNRRWTALPPEEQQYRRDCIDEAVRTRSLEQAMAFADARAQERTRLAERCA